MKDATFWKQYPVVTDPGEIEKIVRKENFISGNVSYELLCLKHRDKKTCLLISIGTGGHAYVFAELAYLIFNKGFDVFIMPKHGGSTVPELMQRHEDAVNYLRGAYGEHIHVFAEGLGGFVVFYLALKGIQLRSLIFENSPAVLTDPAFHLALKRDGKAGRRRAFLLPWVAGLVKIFPKFPVPIKTYLDWHEMMDQDGKHRKLEKKLVQLYDQDPDFDKTYPLNAIMSLVNSPPPGAIEQLSTPTLFIYAKRGVITSYLRQLFSKLTMTRKRWVEVDGSVFWMLSEPDRAADIITRWISEIELTPVQF